jgi:hypothetical protein
MTRKSEAEAMMRVKRKVYPWADMKSGDEAERGKRCCLRAWREEHPGKPDPDDDILAAWVVESERAEFTEAWKEEHPGRHVPDYPEIRRWNIEALNRGKAAILKEIGIEPSKPTRH